MSGRNTRFYKTDHRKKLQKNSLDLIQNINQTRVAKDIKQKDYKNKLTYRFNEKDFNDGIRWFESGLSLDEASEDLRNNDSFIAGFEKGKWIQYVNQQAYNTGIEYFERGISFDDIPDNYKHNEFFMNGYNDRMNNRCK